MLNMIPIKDIDRRLIIIKLSFMLTLLVLPIFSTVNLIEKNMEMALVDFLFIFPAALGLYFLKKNYDIDKIATFAAILLFIILLFITVVQSGVEYSLMSPLVFAFAIMMLKGAKKGLYYSVVFYSTTFIIVYSYIDVSITMSGYIRFVVVSLIMISMAYYYEKTTQNTFTMLNNSMNEVENLNETLKVEIEEKIKEQSLLLSLFDKGDTVLFKWNCVKNWSIADVSLSVKDLIGYSRDDIISDKLDYASLVYKDDRQRVKNEVSKAIESNSEFFKHKPYRIVTKNGSIKWVLDYTIIVRDKNNNVTHFIGSVSDITELKEQNKILEESQKNAHLGSWKWDLLTDEIIWTDEAFRIFGEKEQSFLPTYERFMSYLDDEDKLKLDEAINSSIELHKPYNFKHKIKHQDGSIYYVQEAGKTYYDDNGIATSMIGTVLDITNTQKAEDTLKKQSKMAQMGEMLSMIAHQWRQPLGAISSTVIDMKLQSELKLFDIEKKEEAQKYESYINNSLNDINTFVQNLTTTIDDFRNFYKPNRKLNKNKIENVIEKSLSIVNSSLIGNGIEIIKEYNSKEEIEIYDSELIQVILNILKNAQDNFIEKKIKNPYIKITIENRKFSICDNGEGIPTNIIDKVFDPYFSTKKEKNGTGLGLYMSKMIIEEHHNGKIHVENTDDGVCFIIKL